MVIHINVYNTMNFESGFVAEKLQNRVQSSLRINGYDCVIYDVMQLVQHTLF